MICQHGDLTFARHNEIRDITTDWLSKVCYDVAVEPPLQQLTGETIIPVTVNQQDEAHAHIHAGGTTECFLDVRVFHPNTPSYYNSTIPAIYQYHE